jgi:phosphoglycolate phosphatase-like HAD superfamily hydrolase
MLAVFKTAGSIDRQIGGGRNYRQIVEESLASTELSSEQINLKWKDFNLAVIQWLTTTTHEEPRRIQALPGGLDLVDVLTHRNDILTGIITGNPRSVGEIKLRTAGYNPVDFKVMVFGDEADTRTEQVELARQRAKILTAMDFSGTRTVIIGDTLHDITCGRQSGSRCIIVSTGDGVREELVEAQPDFFFDDLSDTTSILEAIY